MSATSQRVKRQRHQLQKSKVEFLGGKCLRCGYTGYPAALVAHHVNPAKKSFSTGTNHSTSWKKLKEELRKCVLLCSNCHITVHATEEPEWFDESNIPDYGGGDVAESDSEPGTCEDCGSEISLSSTRCRSCSAKFINASERSPVFDWPPLAEILARLEQNSGNMSKTAREIGVSNTGLRLFLKRTCKT